MGPLENFPKSRTRYDRGWVRGHKKVSVKNVSLNKVSFVHEGGISPKRHFSAT